MRAVVSRDQQPVGFLTMAFGAPRYLRLAENLALSLRLHMPNVPIAIVTDVEGPLSLFDDIIRLDKSRGTGLQQKVFIDSYSPFHDTCFIDSDCIVTRPFWLELAEISKYSFATTSANYYTNPGGHDLSDRVLVAVDDDEVFSHFFDFKKALTTLKIKKFPMFNGGLYYFTRDDKSAQVFEYAKGILGQWRSLGIKPFRDVADEPNDEIIFGLAMEMAGEMAGVGAFDDHGKLMRTRCGWSGL
jgi:hypothetical protein